MPNNILVVGTGTIGLPLIGLLARCKDQLGLDGVWFNKNTPLSHDVAHVRQLLDLGCKLVTDTEKFGAFSKLGLDPYCSKKEALKKATVVIDCTPMGNENKKSIYEYLDGPNMFIAQGSERGFGMPYALGINDRALDPASRYLQVVSCNTHNMSVLLQCLGFRPDGRKALARGAFVCMRRANDVSQDGSFVASPEVGAHGDPQFGTHHARDAHDLFGTIGERLWLWSSAVKLNTQYMHAMWFQLQMTPGNHLSLAEAAARLEGNERVALTSKRSANRVFSFGRDHGFYGRILSQTVVSRETLASDGEFVTGFCFTPQDGNSLMSSVAAAMWAIHGCAPWEGVAPLRKYLFQSV